MASIVSGRGREAPPVDVDLLNRFVVSRSEESFRALVEQFGPPVWQVCVRLSRQRHDAEDAFQATFVTLAERASQIRHAESIGSWLYGVAYRTSLRVRQRSRSRRRREFSLNHEAEARDTAPDRIEKAEQWQIVHDELHRLPRKYREPLVMQYLLGQPLAEICAALAVSPTSLKGRLQRARRELRARLAVRGVVSLSLATIAFDLSRGTSLAQEVTGELTARTWTTIKGSAGVARASVDAVAGVVSGSTRAKGPLSGITQFAAKELSPMFIILEAVSVVSCAVAMAFGLPARSVESAAPREQLSAVAEGEASAPAEIARFDRTFAEAPVKDAAPAGTDDKQSTVLQYGDGTPDGKKSIAGTGEMIHFTAPEDKAMLTAIELHGSRYGNPQAPKEDFKIYVLADDRTKVLHTELVPYGRFERGEARWVTLKFSKPVEIPRSFWVIVDFNAEATKGVYVSYDTSTGGEHSMVGLPGKKAAKTSFGGDWMIRAVVEK